MARDYYEVLGVTRDVKEGDLKKAYRRLAMEFHPDRNNGDQAAEERFKEVTEAYEVLHDPDKRARYDRFGSAGLSGQSSTWHHFDLSEALSVFMRDFGGMGGFDAFFGGGERARRARQRGQDIQIVLRLTLAEVATGVEAASAEAASSWANRASSAPSTTRCPLSSCCVEKRPRSAQRRTVSSLTPRSWPTSFSR